jgi:hypothetical protein
MKNISIMVGMLAVAGAIVFAAYPAYQRQECARWLGKQEWTTLQEVEAYLDFQVKEQMRAVDAGLVALHEHGEDSSEYRSATQLRDIAARNIATTTPCLAILRMDAARW